MNLPTDLLLGAAPPEGELTRVGPVSMQLRDVSEWHHHLTQEDVMAQCLAPIHSDLQDHRLVFSLKTIQPE